MFSSWINRLFFLVILLTYTMGTVLSYCPSGNTCSSPYSSLVWCCPSSQICGSTYPNCGADDDSSLSPAVVAVIIISSIFFFIVCLICCLHMQQQRRIRTVYAMSAARRGTTPYQQQIPRRPVPAAHVRPVSNIGTGPLAPPYSSMYEAPPPSYEVAIATLPTIHPSLSLPPVTTTVQ